MTQAILSSIPVDAFVAMRPDEESARAAIETLRRAGFRRHEMGIVDAAAAPDCPAKPCARRAHPAESGTVWGICWAVLVVAAAIALPSSPLTWSALALLSAALLVLHVDIVVRRVMPERCGSVPRREPPEAWLRAYAGEFESDRRLVVVRGTRSELALARQLLDA